jgi:hypothetical protein
MADAIRATYADIKTVRTRKVYQIVFEGPIEEMGAAMALFGPPMPDAEVWAGIARLKAPGAEIEHANDESKPARPLSQVAGYLCNIVTFRRWLSETGEGDAITGTDGAADEVRRRCGIKSRAELDTNSEAASIFRTMRADYDNWMRDVA